LNKKYKLKADEIENIAVGYGGCIATDMVTVEGKKVGYMYRDDSSFDQDSGWCFTAGLESQEYMNNPDNHGVYDVNTIANYDPDITELLDSPVGSVFERDSEGNFVKLSENQS